MKAATLVILLTFFFQIDSAQAEPWMSNRFAQNCSSCHAPGRLNRSPSKRRCTLSCQGCHVNPNGGGLRNHYGKWNSERWVRSFYTDLAWNKKAPAPLGKQKYMHKKLDKKHKLAFAKRGAPLVGIKGVIKGEEPYFESSNYTAARSEVEELSRITRNDPYRQERKNMLTAGGDFRAFFIKHSEGAPSKKFEQGTFYPMVFDFGVRVRPIREKLSFVYEGRAINTNLQEPSSIDHLFGATTTLAAITRSAYVLVDDLWYNTYFQYGYYRPMFGIYNPNHNALMTNFTDLGVTTKVKAAGFGAAPNVPFIIANYIMPTQGASATDISSEGGYNVTLGMRFVRFGANMQFSYWDTKNDSPTLPSERTMWNLSGGFKLNRFVVTGEMNNIRRKVAGLDETKVILVDGKFRFWKEMYLQAAYTQANAAYAIQNQVSGTGISPGSATETQFGFRAFLLAGLEFETLFATKLNKEDRYADFKEETMTVQMHAYF